MEEEDVPRHAVIYSGKEDFSHSLAYPSLAPSDAFNFFKTVDVCLDALLWILDGSFLFPFLLTLHCYEKLLRTL